MTFKHKFDHLIHSKPFPQKIRFFKILFKCYSSFEIRYVEPCISASYIRASYREFSVKRNFFTIGLSLLTILFIGACNKKTSDNKLVIFHAGSLSVPFKKISKEFKKTHPNADIFLEAAGSRTCARKISDLNKACDVMASADYSVINNLLIPKHADFNIKFATNEMCIVFTKDSKGSDSINKDNWYDVLLNEDIAFGRSDPNADPCGYRAVLTIKLSEKYYKADGLAEKMLAKDNRFIRPKETDLLALLESKTLDYLFLYRSVAQQHNLNFLVLPDEVNLKSSSMADFYKTATVDISGKTPGEKITKKGAPMVYGITIPKSSPSPKLALEFVKFILSKDGGVKVMEENGQPSAVGSISNTFEKIPEPLQVFAKKQ